MKKELLSTFKYDEQGNLLELPTAQQLEGLTYVQATIREIQRKSTIIPGTLATASKVTLKIF